MNPSRHPIWTIVTIFIFVVAAAVYGVHDSMFIDVRELVGGPGANSIRALGEPTQFQIPIAELANCHGPLIEMYAGDPSVEFDGHEFSTLQPADPYSVAVVGGSGKVRRTYSSSRWSEATLVILIEDKGELLVLVNQKPSIREYLREWWPF